MYRSYIGRRVLVSMDAGGLDGTLARVDKEGLVLENVTLIGEDSSQRPLDGTILLPFSSFVWVQVV